MSVAQLLAVDNAGGTVTSCGQCRWPLLAVDSQLTAVCLIFFHVAEQPEEAAVEG